jgi:hypothetical protein
MLREIRYAIVVIGVMLAEKGMDGAAAFEMGEALG